MKKLFSWILLFAMLLSIVAWAALPPEGPSVEIQSIDNCTCPSAWYMNYGDAGHMRICSTCGNQTFPHHPQEPTCETDRACRKCNYLEPGTRLGHYTTGSSYTCLCLSTNHPGCTSTQHGKMCTRYFGETMCGEMTEVANHVWGNEIIEIQGIAYKWCIIPNCGAFKVNH
ncbi:MAG: hypothetical protein IKD06_06530 [Clostridia bacterium]|nr:hypothetical protein [Clostridia bacterium]